MSQISKASQFWIQGSVDFDKGKAPRWSETHLHYKSYMNGYTYAQREKKRKDMAYKRNNSLWSRLKAKVKSWIK